MEKTVHNFDTEKVTRDMQDMIRCKTVSNRDENLVDRSQFKKFQDLLEERFPLIYSKGKPEHLGKTGLLFHIKAEAEEKSNHPKQVVFMSHYDVVPVDNETEWEKPAFEGIIEDGILWGRGAMDTKGTLCGVMESVEYMLSTGWKPSFNLYLSFSGEEEIDGESCPEIVKYLENKGITPDFVLDEGGAVVENAFPGVKEKCAMVGIAEKGSVNYEVTIDLNAGHASAPPKHSAAGYAAQAIQILEDNPQKPEFTETVHQMFSTLGPKSKGILKILFSHNKFFGPLIKTLSKYAGGELNAMLHSTCAVTRLQGSPAFNVLPGRVVFGMNCRLLGSDTVEGYKTRIEKLLEPVSRKVQKKGGKLSVKVVNGMNPSIESDTKGPAWKAISQTITKTWPDVIVSPYLMMACSDSRHYCRITDKVYHFSCMYMSKEDRLMIHGKNERISLETLYKTVDFYCNLLETLQSF